MIHCQSRRVSFPLIPATLCQRYILRWTTCSDISYTHSWIFDDQQIIIWEFHLRAPMTDHGRKSAPDLGTLSRPSHCESSVTLLRRPYDASLRDAPVPRTKIQCQSATVREHWLRNIADPKKYRILSPKFRLRSTSTKKTKKYFRRMVAAYWADLNNVNWRSQRDSHETSRSYWSSLYRSPRRRIPM